MMLPTRTNATNRLAWTDGASSPLSLIDDVRREFDQVFDRMLGTWHEPTLGMRSMRGTAMGWMPSMDVQETGQELRLSVEAPGLGPDDLHVEVDGDALVISGEKRVERDEKDGAWRVVERRNG